MDQYHHCHPHLTNMITKQFLMLVQVHGILLALHILHAIHSLTEVIKRMIPKENKIQMIGSIFFTCLHVYLTRIFIYIFQELHPLRCHILEGTPMMICTYLILLTINSSHSICTIGKTKV